MEATSKTNNRINYLSRAIDTLFAEMDRRNAEDQVLELKRRADEAETRTRRAIERLCRKRYYREKYTALGLWPLPPQGTPIN